VAGGIDPLGEAAPPLLPPRELRRRTGACKEALDIVAPNLKAISDMLKGTGFRVNFSDRDGYIIYSLHDDKTAEELCGKTMSFPGANRSEEREGTNSTALAMILKTPVQISGAEHFKRIYHMWSCSSAPVTGPDGELVGAVNIAGRYELMHKHTLAAAAAAAKTIENGLQVKRINGELTRNNRQMSALLGMSSDGMLYMKGGKIYQLNEEMCNLLGRPRGQLLGRDVLEAVVTSPSLGRMLGGGKDYKNESVILEGKGQNYNCLLDVSTVYNSEGEEAEKVLVFIRVDEVRLLAEKIQNEAAKYTFSDILGESAPIKESIFLAQKASLYNSRVIIEGESGTGKEMLAQAIHNYSARRYNPFVAVDCGAIPRELFESELFGYEGGAFTGAKKEGKAGLMEAANKGTLFLDEIANMPGEMQMKLLRVLQDGAITRVGGTEKVQVDVRVIAATNTDLKRAVARGEFREDLFYRLNVLHIVMPSLRERREDIPIIIQKLLQSHPAAKRKATVSPEAMELLAAYDWPGNIRQLNNVIERALIMSSDGRIKAEDLPLELTGGSGLIAGRAEREILPLDEMALRYVREAVAENGGNVSKAAKILRISRTTVYKMLEAGARRGEGGSVG
jgi:transcriptional regulator with PAS, ATPase and Fis domain